MMLKNYYKYVQLVIVTVFVTRCHNGEFGMEM